MPKQYIEIIIALIVVIFSTLGLVDATNYPAESGYAPITVLTFSIILALNRMGHSAFSLRCHTSALALKFSPADYFWLAVFGMTTIVVLLSDNSVKDFLSACFVLIVGMVGINPLNGAEHFAFDNLNLLGNIHIVIMLTGLYAIPLAMDLAISEIARMTSNLPQSEGHSHFRWAALFPVWSKSSIVGIIVIIPAIGGNIAALLAWNEQRRPKIRTSMVRAHQKVSPRQNQTITPILHQP